MQFTQLSRSSGPYFNYLGLYLFIYLARCRFHSPASAPPICITWRMERFNRGFIELRHRHDRMLIMITIDDMHDRKGECMKAMKAFQNKVDNELVFYLILYN